MSLPIEQIIRDDLSKIAKANDNAAIIETMQHTRRQIKEALPDCPAYQQRETLTSLDNAFKNLIGRLNPKKLTL